MILINFSEDFFHDEERCGFFVPQEMKRAWAAQMELLSEINDLCVKHQLKWYAAWGTLLGAVRHKGFIPWDDDIDIWMCRRDYDCLIDLIRQGKLSDELYVLHFSLEEKWYQPFLRICNGKAMVLTAEHLRKYHGCPYVVGVDIFPLDNLCDSKEDEELQSEILNIIYSVIKMSGDGTIQEEGAQVRDWIQQIEQMLQVTLNQTCNTKNELWSLWDRIISLYKSEDSRRLMDMWLSRRDTSVGFEKQWFDETILMDFENMKIPIPKDYIKTLEVCFEDWNTPINWNTLVKDTTTHSEYPFYNMQRERLIETFGELYEEEIRKIYSNG